MGLDNSLVSFNRSTCFNLARLSRRDTSTFTTGSYVPAVSWRVANAHGAVVVAALHGGTVRKMCRRFRASWKATLAMATGACFRGLRTKLCRW